MALSSRLLTRKNTVHKSCCSSESRSSKRGRTKKYFTEELYIMHGGILKSNCSDKRKISSQGYKYSEKVTSSVDINGSV